MSKKKFVIGTVCCIGALVIGLGSVTAYNIEQDKQEQIRIEKIEKRKEQERIKKKKEQERIAKEKEEKEKAELKRKQEEEEKKKQEEIKTAQEAERLAAEQAAQQAAQQKIAEENNAQENYTSNEEAVQNNGAATTVNTQSSISFEEFMVLGVVYSNGYKYTYYSQSVLPGGGLNIPGRHVSGGFVRDCNGYIVLANDAPKGTIIETPFGTGMVYDRGTYGSHIDVYVQ